MASSEVDFVRCFPDAAMITVRPDGSAHMARVELAVVEGQIQTSGAAGLVRTRNLRRDARCSLFVFGPHPYWLGLETRAITLQGPESLIALMRARHGESTPPGMVMGHDSATDEDRLYTEAEYVTRVQAEQRFVHGFEILRSYGNYDRTSQDPALNRPDR